jgi:hypothetical protein
MAHWSSTEFHHYAAEDDLRNAKPRWQELAEVYSSSSSPFSTATAPRPNRNSRQMDRHTPENNNGDNRFWRRRLRTHDDNVASLGASRSRSRSRSSRPRTSIFGDSATGARGRRKPTLYQRTFSKQAILFSLLALVGLFSSWFGASAARSPGSIGRSVAKAMWTPQTGSLYGEVRRHVCDLPGVPRVLNCDHSPETEVSRDNSIRHVIPSIVFAMSENLDTVDAILDILEDIKTQLAALQKMEMALRTTGVIKTAEPLRIPVPNLRLPVKPIPFARILNYTSVLRAGLADWENDKDNLLKLMQAQINYLVPKHQDGPFHKAVVRELEKIATSLEKLRKSRLSPLMKTWSDLLLDTPIPQDSDAGTQENTSTLPKLSVFKRFVLWSFPFTSHSYAGGRKLTRAERTQILHKNVLAIQPHLSAIYASNSKAHRSAMTAKTLVQRNESWVGRLRELVWGRKERFVGDMIGGFMEMRGWCLC